MLVRVDESTEIGALDGVDDNVAEEADGFARTDDPEKTDDELDDDDVDRGVLMDDE